MEKNKNIDSLFYFWKEEIMKIVYCVPSMYRLGGIERIIARKANYFVNNGLDVSIITTDQNGRSFYFEVDARVKHYDLRINYEKNKNRKFLGKIFYFMYNKYLHKKRLKKLLLQLNADIVISTFFNEMGILPQINDGSKKIVEFHFSRYMFCLNRRKGILGIIDDCLMNGYIKTLKKYTRFVVLSEEDACSWKELNNVEVIYNICPIDIKSKSKLNNNRVISVGRYESQKGFNMLIKAWAKVSEKVKGWELHIVGEGSLRNVLQKQINDYGLANSIFLDGASIDICRDYLESSIAVFTSNYEGFSLALVEAETAGLPIVSFNTPCGPKDIINDGINGFLIDNGDIDRVAEKIQLLINDFELRKKMGLKALENSKMFTEGKIMPQWIALFRHVLKE